MKLMYFVVMLLLATTVMAQPGGGGGLQIETIVDRNGQLIERNDTALKVFYAFLSNDSTHRIVRQYTDTMRDSPYRYRGKPHLYLAPYIGIPAYYGVKNPTILKLPHQRLTLLYKGDTMTVDFLDLYTSHGAGATDRVDTLKLLPGHFTSYRNIANRLPNYFVKPTFQVMVLPKIVDSLYATMRRGLTDETIPTLTQYGLLKQEKPLQQFVFQNEERFDTVFLKQVAADTLPWKAVKQKGGAITVTTTAFPLVTDSGLQYKFSLASFTSVTGHAFTIVDKEGYNKYSALTNSYQPATLFINGKPFTGSIKFYFRGGGGASGVLCEYREGKLVQRTPLLPVNNPDEEAPLERRPRWDV